jgi:hypothetical protein
MKKLVSHLVEIEVPDDFPSGLNPEVRPSPDFDQLSYHRNFLNRDA